MAEAPHNSVVGKIKNFTPIFDSVVQDVGLVGATVFGVIWRHCQMSRGVCDASKETLADKCGVSERTVIRWTKELCKAGYLEDLTPDLRNKPHTYRDTGKVRLVAEVSAVTEDHIDPIDGMTESHPAMTESHSSMTESQSHHDRESHEETSSKQGIDKEETISPPNSAEKPPEPEILLQTENPNSVTNRPVDSGDENQGSSASTGDYTGDLQRHANGGESWTVPPEAGGTDAFRDGVLGAFCWLIGIPKDSLDDDKQGQWAAKFRELASLWDASAEDIRRCILALPESEYHFKSYSVPYQHSFQDDLYVLVARLKGGQPLVKESPRASPGRKRGHRETVWEGEVEQVRQFVEQQEAAAAEEEPLDVEAMLGPDA